MKATILDTETTGLYKYCDVIQLSCFNIDINEAGQISEIKFHERYFNTDIPISPSVSQIHGITNQNLLKSSEGLYIEDTIGEFKDYIWDKDNYIIGYNVSFDNRLLNYNLQRVGIPNLKSKGIIDIMSLSGHYGFKHKIKLSEMFSYVTNLYNVPKEKTDAIFKQLTGKESILHDSTYDAFITMICFILEISYLYRK